MLSSFVNWWFPPVLTHVFVSGKRQQNSADIFLVESFFCHGTCMQVLHSVHSVALVPKLQGMHKLRKLRRADNFDHFTNKFLDNFLPLGLQRPVRTRP